MKLIPWNWATGVPNCFRSRANASAASSAACAKPTEHAAIPSRPPSSASIAIRKPTPSSPMR